MQRAVLYTRVSSREQSEHGRSLGTQFDRCRNYAVARGYQVTAAYRDVHTGADLLGRPQLGLLRTALRAGTIDVVVVLTVDRLSRDLVHLHFLLVEAEALRARFEFVLERLDRTPEGQLLKAILGFAAEMERLTIRARGGQSVRARIRRGRWLGITPPFGYRWHRDQSGTLEIEATTAAVVQRVFAAVGDGRFPRQIAMALTAEASPIPQACPSGWSAKAIRRILRNPIYWGAIAPDESPAALPSTIAPGSSESQVQPQRYVPPPIVTLAQWQAANDRLLAVTQRGRTFPDPVFADAYLLAGGLARCGCCGRPLLGRGVHEEALFYRCAGASRRMAGSCPPSRFGATCLDDRV